MPLHYICYRADRPPIIDGKLDDQEWTAVPWTEDFRDIEGSIRPRPVYRTRARLLWDDQNLYIGAELEEPFVWATLTQRDSVIFRDNDFEVFIDPDGDNHEYYELEINALNTVWDLLLIKPYRDGGPPVTGWDIAGLQTAVHVDGTLNDCSDRDRGWSVEMALPWHALAECAHRKTPPAEGDLWRINFSRVEWDINVVDGRASKIPDHPEHNWVWSPQGAVNMHLPEHWGYLQFTNLPPRRARAITDPAATVRAGLMQIYYAQSQYHRQHGAYAPVIADLRSCGAGRAEGLRNLKVEATETGFVASATQELPGGRSARWHVKEDSRLWTQPAD